MLRCELLQARVQELQEQSDAEDELRQVRDDFARADKMARDAGGRTSGRLHLDISSLARRIRKKETAVSKSSERVKGLAQKRDEATAALVEAEKDHLALCTELDEGRKKYADLVTQQAAEACPREESRTVWDAIAKLTSAGGALPAELTNQVDIIRKSFSRFFPDDTELEQVLLEVGLDPGSDTSLSSSDDSLDAEPEVTEELFRTRRTAKQTRRRLFKQRHESVRQALRQGKLGGDVVRQYADDVRQAEARLKEAIDRLREARARARERRRRAMGSAASSNGAGCQAPAPVQARGPLDEVIPCLPADPTPTEDLRETPAPVAPLSWAHECEVDDDESVPCLPPSKWRRAADRAGSASDATNDETPVPTTAAPGPAAPSSPRSASSTAARRSAGAPQPLSSSASAVQAVVADAAVALARTSVRQRVASAERRRAAGSAARADDRQPSPGTRVGRSKSPRRKTIDRQSN